MSAVLTTQRKRNSPLVRRMLPLDMLPKLMSELVSRSSSLEDVLVEGNDEGTRVLSRVVFVVDRGDSSVLNERRTAEAVLEFGGTDLEPGLRRG